MGVRYNYSTGHANAVMGDLRRCIGQYARRYDYIKVGITKNPEVRWLQHQSERRLHDDSWEEMVVIYETSSWRRACMVENLLIKYAQSRPYKCVLWNAVGGGGGQNPVLTRNCRAYVYVLLDGKTPLPNLGL